MATKTTTAKTTAAKTAEVEATPTPTACKCGCGAPTKSTYAPGHDARHAGQIGRWLLANPDATPAQRKTQLANLPTPALQAKAERVVETAAAKEQAKQAKAEARAKAKAAAKAAYEAALVS